jgi:type VI secretion system protein VasG
MRIDTKSLVKKLDGASLKSLEASVNLAVQQKMSQVLLVHWLCKIASDSSSVFCLLLENFEIKPEDFLKTIESEAYEVRGNHGEVPALSSDVKNLIYDSWLLASVDYHSTQINSGHIFLCLLTNLQGFSLSSLAKTLLKSLDVEKVKVALKDILSSQEKHDAHNILPPLGAQYSSDALKRFTIDLIDQAKQGLLDRAIGRNNELQQMIDVLCRRKQNNPILVGEAGTGKTAIVEELAFCMLEKNVPDELKNASLRLLDFAALQAGASVQGEFESRIKDLLNSIQKAPYKIVLFIDEIHNFLGASGKGADAANLLKPALSKGLSLIGATTWAEYKKSFEKDAALNRRFQLIKVLEPSEETAVDIMRKVALVLEKHHGTLIKESAILNAVALSVRYMNHLRLPDKAVSLLDSACTRIKLQQSMPPVAVRDLAEKIQLKKLLLERMKTDLSIPKAKVENLLEEIQNLETQYLEHHQNWQGQVEIVQTIWANKHLEDGQNFLMEAREELSQRRNDKVCVYEFVDGDIVADIVSHWTGIPVSKRGSVKEFEALINLDEQIKKRVIGQDHAIEKIADAIRVSKAEMSDARKPIGVFLLVGESGVGKTETALSLAETVYGHERRMITINMSEYKEGHKVATLIGSPPGYVGFGEGGRLTEQVRRNPYSVILLDEIEKAHPNIQDLFLQVFDKGTLTDSEGIEVDFKNTVIIMTSNLAAKHIAQFCANTQDSESASVLHSKDQTNESATNLYHDGQNRAAQFEEDSLIRQDQIIQDTPKPQEKEFSGEEIQSLTDSVHEQLLKSLKPEFLGRLTVIPYLSLTETILRNIIKLQLNRLDARLLKAHAARLTYDDGVVKALLSICKVSPIGARQVEQTINEEILPDLSLAILNIKFQNMTFGSVKLTENDGCFAISMQGVRNADQLGD